MTQIISNSSLTVDLFDEIKAGVYLCDELNPNYINHWIKRADELAKSTIRWLSRQDRWGEYWIDEGITHQYTTNKEDGYQQGDLDHDKLVEHYDGTTIKGFHPSTTIGQISRWVGIDLDLHSKAKEGKTAFQIELMRIRLFSDAIKISKRLDELHIHHLIEDSNGDGGIHIWIPFWESILIKDSYALGKYLIRYVDPEDERHYESFPKQNKLNPKGKATCEGNWLRFPGKHHTRNHWSRLWSKEQDSWLNDKKSVECWLNIQNNNSGHILEFVDTLPEIVEPEVEYQSEPLPDGKLHHSVEWYLKNGHKTTVGLRNDQLFYAACLMKGSLAKEQDAIDQLTPVALASGLDPKEIENSIASAFSDERSIPIKKQIEADWIRPLGADNFQPYDQMKLPGILGTMAKETSTKTDTNPDIATVSGIAVIQSIIQTYITMKRKSWDKKVTPSHAWLVRGGSAIGKTRALMPMFGKLQQYEFDRANNVKKQNIENYAKLRVLKKLQTKGNDKDTTLLPGQFISTEDETNLTALSKQIELLSHPRPDSSIFIDVTPEGLIVDMQYCNQKAIAIEAEAIFVSRMLGRPYKTIGVSQCIALLDGDRVNIRRKGSDPVSLERGALTILNFGVEETVMSILNDEHFRGGFGQRFIYISIPEQDIPEATEDSIDATVQNEWDKLISELYCVPLPLDDDGKLMEPLTVTFTDDAEKILKSINQRITKYINKHKSGWNSFWLSWMMRYEMFIMQVASAFHAIRYKADFPHNQIGAEDVKSADEYMNHAMNHSDIVINGSTENETEVNAEIILTFLDEGKGGKYKRKGTKFTARDINQGTKKIKGDKFKSKGAKIQEALNLLEESGMLSTENKGKRTIYIRLTSK